MYETKFDKFMKWSCIAFILISLPPLLVSSAWVVWFFIYFWFTLL